MGSGFKSTVTLLAGLAAGSAIFDVYLRTVEATPLWRILPLAEASLYGPDRNAGYGHRKGARGIWITEARAPVAINALALRDTPSRTAAAPARVSRIAVAGDSIVEALQVPLEQTFVARAEAELQRSGRAVEVVNLGLAGARPAVIVERLRSAAGTLSLTGALVSVSASDLLIEAEDDDSEIAGYTRGPDGKAVITHGFRQGRGFSLRSSGAGEAIYWTIDHVKLALVLNNRRNAGFFAELDAPPPRPDLGQSKEACAEASLSDYEVLWEGRAKGFANARLDAFLGDLAGIAREARLRIVLALRGPSTECPSLAQRRMRLAEVAEKRIAAAGLGFLDHDLALDLIPGTHPRARLHGFGARIGGGHLNADGHVAYSAVLMDVIERLLLPRR